MTDRNLIDYYRARAAEYEQAYYRDMPERRREIDDQAEGLRRLVRGKDILDLACGTGYWTEIMSRTARFITAADISAEMLREARNKDYNAPTAFVMADLYSLPFQTESFDAITLGFWFSHQPKQEYDLFFRQLAPPVKDGGFIWMIDNNPPAEGSRMDSVRTDAYGNNYKRRYLQSGEEYVILKNYFSEDQLREIFAPYFTIRRLVYEVYYWSILLSAVS
jgi:ubiquinone/menaquinone biosynthesis C-methylase UbiE